MSDTPILSAYLVSLVNADATEIKFLVDASSVAEAHDAGDAAYPGFMVYQVEIFNEAKVFP